MKNSFVILVVISNLVLLTYSDVVINTIPNEFLYCREPNKAQMYKCIQERIDSDNKIKQHNGYRNGDIQLQIDQSFFWHETKRIRRECRALPREEWHQLMDAINTLKNDKSLEPNVYDYIADFHTKRAVDSVHFGSNFFGWHRFYILKFEELLRKINPNITLCYWDSRLDNVLRDPQKSRMFTDEFMGTKHGPIKSGPFADWKTIRNIPLRRNVGQTGKLISPHDIENVLSKSHHVQITTPTADYGANVEDMHNNVHAFIGGQMNDFNTSSQDPYFWLHHCFIDSVWEKFCTKLRNKGIDPQDDYVLTDDPLHHPFRIMDRLFPLKNSDGYSDYFPRNIYEYEDYAKCPDCLGSPYLTCDEKHNRCRAVTKDESLRVVDEPLKRITTNYLSQPLEKVDILSGSQNMKSFVFIPIKIIFRNAMDKHLRHKNITGCDYNGEESDLCSDSVAIVQSKGVSYEGTFKNYIANDVCIPQWSYAYVGVQNPKISKTKAFISVTDKTGNACYAYCLSESTQKYGACAGFVDVTRDNPRMYSDTLEDISESGFGFNPLQADMNDYRIKMVFLCY